MAALNTKQMVGEIASRCGIRLDEADPAFVVVRLSQIALEEACQELVDRVSMNLREFEAAVEKVQTRAGRYVAAEFNDGAAALRRELQDDIVGAGARAVELVERVHRAHTRAALIRWISVGLLAGIGLLVAGAWIGAHWS
jgi:hypothetical protein